MQTYNAVLTKFQLLNARKPKINVSAKPEKHTQKVPLKQKGQ